MKGCVQWNPVNDWKDFSLQQVLNPGPLDQQLSTQLSELSKLLQNFDTYIL